MKDVLLVIFLEDKIFYLQYQTKKAVEELSANAMDMVNFPINALPTIKSHLASKQLTFCEL
jgi:hypothetical protein